MSSGIVPFYEAGQFAFGLENNFANTPIMDRLWEYTNKAKEAPIDYKHSLAGNIYSSLELTDTDDWFFKNILDPLIKEYEEVFKNGKQVLSRKLFRDKNIPYILDSFWVNFQKQHEFNPLHCHDGIYSFVIWMKIPYDWREQHEIPFIKSSGHPMAGNFKFVYTDIAGRIDSFLYKLDPSYEGIMILFPAEIHHMVYPFYNTPDEERISISGNIVYEI